MSKPIQSDGTVDVLVRGMCERGLSTYRREDVDEVLTDARCQQCTYATLAQVCFQYREASSGWLPQT